MSSNTPPDPSGQTIGAYRLIRPLGAGGMGEVFLAHDDRLDRSVAIKRVRSSAAVDEAQRQRLRREARAVATLSHPAVVQIYDIVEDGAGDSIVMEYVDGTPLSSLLVDGGLTAEAGLRILLHVCDGLAAAHERGLVHRDLKSENIVVTPDGAAKILDFGLARSFDPSAEDPALTAADAAVGTYRSMAPEQCEGRAVDPRTDLWALGVVMYEMLAGRTPFQGRTPLHTLGNVVGFDPPAVRELNRSVPEPLSRLVAALLTKDPDGRPGSAADVAARLEEMQAKRLLGGLVLPRLTPTPDSGIDPIRALEHASAPDRGRRPGRIRPPPRRRAAVLRSGAALLVLAVAALGGRHLLGRGAADPGAPTRIMVFPLVSSLASQGGASVGEDVATVIGHALDGVEPLQWLDGWPLLDAEARNDPRRLELGRMAELARSRGCSFFVWGRVIQQGDSARVLLGLHGVRDGDAIASADAGAALGDAWRAGLRALNGLLPRLIETEVPDVEADLGNRPPEAVARFLLGEAALRRAKFSDALGHFREAFAFDSTFGVAGIRGAQAASWIHDPAAASALIDRALTLPLTGRAESFARGVQAYVANDAEAAVRHLEAALAEDSLFSVAWAQLGETYRHLAPRMVPSSAPGPFERAQGLDSLAGYVLFHRLEELTRAGDLERARRARQQFVDGSPDAALQAQIDLMIGCADGGAATLDPGPRLREWPWEVLYAAAQLGMDGDQRACSEVLYHALLVGDTVADPNAGYRSWNALVGLTGSFLVGNRVEDAGRLLEAMADGFESVQALLDASAAGASGVTLAAAAPAWSKGRPAWRAAREAELTRWSELAVLVGALYPQLESIGRRGADDIAAAAGPDLTGIDYRTSLWLLGFWASRNEDGATAERALERLREIAAGQDPLDQAYTSSLADALAAHITLSTGDSTAALEQFRALTAQAPPSFLYWELLAPLSVERLVRARLELEAGEPEVADRLLRGFAEPNAQTNPVFLPLALERCRVAAGGDARRAECARTLERLGWPGRGPAGTDTSIAPS